MVAISKQNLAKRSCAGLNERAATKARTVPLCWPKMLEPQSLLQLTRHCSAVLVLLLLPQSLTLSGFGLPLQTLKFSLFGLLHSKPIHKWMLAAKANGIDAHLNRKRGGAANSAYNQNRLTSQLGQALGLPKLLHKHVPQVFCGDFFTDYFARKAIAVPACDTKNVAQVIKKLLRLGLNPSRQIKFGAGTVDSEVGQVRQGRPFGQHNRPLVVPVDAMLIKFLGNEHLKMRTESWHGLADAESTLR